MIGWLRRLLGPGPPSRREMMAVKDACEGLEARVDQHYSELKALRGAVNGLKRREKVGEGAPGPTNDGEPVPETTPARFTPSAHLARRFRGF